MWGPPPWGGGWLVGICLIIGLVWLVIALARSDGPGLREARQSATSAAIEHVRWRYAAGEITREQYEDMLRVLHSSRAQQ
jgi:uncharacterized membrane protein